MTVENIINSTNQHTIWIIDDDDSIRRVMQIALERAGYMVKGLANADNALKALALTDAPDLIFCDIRMPGTSGLDFLDALSNRKSAPSVIIMTAHSDLDATVNAYSHGAYDYLPKPFDINRVIELAKNAITEIKQAGMQEPQAKKSAVLTQTIIGDSAPMQEVYRIIGRLHNSSINVLVTGETGTGKELIAQALHQNSPRAKKPFIAINTAAIPKDLLESELFGYEKGAFTGATSQRKGRFEQADGGTLFLDEIGDMPYELQTRLLRVLAEGEFYRVGGQQSVKVDVRIVAATHQDLNTLVKDNRFREDLYHRLNVIRLELPPLRARQGDISTLFGYFLEIAATEINDIPKQLHKDTEAVLVEYTWPGNVRQLENVMRSLTVMTSGTQVMINDLPLALLPGLALTKEFEKTAINDDTSHKKTQEITSNTNTTSPSIQHTQSSNWLEAVQHWAKTALESGEIDIAITAVEQLEEILITTTLEYTKGHKQEAAKKLGWGRNTLTRKSNEYKLYN
jgi:two-component system nitrogen regulation response regulator GlnG